MLALIIYLLSIVEDLKLLLLIYGLLGLTVIGVVFLLLVLEEELKNFLENNLKILKKIIISLVVSLVLFILMPDSKTIAAMYLIPKIVNNEQVKKTLKKLSLLAFYSI